MKFDDILLWLIARAPATGYDLRRWLATEGIFIRANADQSQIYKTLGRLQKSGLIDFVAEKREAAPDAKVYSATPAGLEYLRQIARSEYVPPARWQEVDFTARYTFVASVDPTMIPRMIDIEIEFRRAQIAKYRTRDRRILPVSGSSSIDSGMASAAGDDIHEYNTQSMDRWLAWLETMREKWSDRLQAGHGS